MRSQARRLIFPLLLCMWPVLALGQTQSASTTGGAIYKKASPAVVTIELYDSKGEVFKSGSGFIVSPEGAILTNYHVIAHSKQATVRLANRDAYDTVEVLDIDKHKDIALIKIKAFGLPSLILGRSNTVEVGDTVFSLSNPLGVLENTLSQGIVSGIRPRDGYHEFQISAPISHGSSGGPIFDANGEVVGIAVGFFEGGQNLNFAIPIDYARGMLSATEARPLASVYEPEPDNSASAAGLKGKDAQPTAPSEEACVSEEAAQEALRLGRALGYPDGEIVEAYGFDACKTLSYLRHEAQQKGQGTPPRSSKIPPGMVEAVSYEYDADAGVVLQTVETNTQFYRLRCQARLFVKCGWLSGGWYHTEIDGPHMYVTTYRNGKPRHVKFEILENKPR